MLPGLDLGWLRGIELVNFVLAGMLFGALLGGVVGDREMVLDSGGIGLGGLPWSLSWAIVWVIFTDAVFVPTSRPLRLNRSLRAQWVGCEARGETRVDLQDRPEVR